MDAFFFDEDYELIVGSSSGGSDCSLLLWSDEIGASAAHNFPNPSSFVPYSDGFGIRDQNRAGAVNINKRVVEFARRSWPAGSARSHEIEKEKGYRHMMSERQRREKQKQSFSALHSLLPNGTKNDKNSIIVAASMEVRDLQRCKEELERRNHDLNKASLGVMRLDNDITREAKIKVRVENPASGIDSMLEALRCIDSLGIETTSIRSNVSSEELSAVIGTREEIAAAEVEKVVQRKLLEAERKLQNKFHGVAQSFTWTNCT